MLVGQASNTSALGQAEMQTDPWIIDTDMDLDDWLALLLALGHSRADIRAVSVVGDGGNRCPDAALSALAIVELAGEGRHIPVACGEGFPVDGFHSMPTAWRDESNSANFDALPAASGTLAPVDAVDLVTQTLRDSDQPISILSLAPLSNLARVFDQAPDVIPMVREIVIMGGAVHASGNVAVPGFPNLPPNYGAEWNVFLDPVAAAAVFTSGIPIRLVPIDATRHVPVSDHLTYTILEGIDTPAGRLAAQILEAVGAIPSFYLWDPLAASVALDRDVCDYRMVPLTVNTTTSPEGWSYPGTAADFPQENWRGEPRRHFDAATSGATEIDPDHGTWVVMCAWPNVVAFTDSLRHSLSNE
ncbi:MAG: nucleoside hydrolase [Pseudomonadota bacterium]